MVQCCGCLAGLREYLRTPIDYAGKRKEFEETVAFLASVPLFRTHLPRSELPKVAQILVRRVWKPGEQLVRQGEVGRAFFLIQQGRARVVTQTAASQPEQTRAVLCKGDYFGGHTMLAERPNVATIVADGDEALVTLSMSRRDFEAAGLRDVLHFPKRAAIHEPTARPSTDKTQLTEKTPEEEDFIRNALYRNANLRALMEASHERVSRLVAVAERREVTQGAEVAQQGKFSNNLFVVRQGSFEITFENNRGQQSAEAAVGLSTMAERLARKQHCLQALSRSSGGEISYRNSVHVIRQPSTPLEGKRSMNMASLKSDSKTPRQGTRSVEDTSAEDEVLRLTESVPLEVGASFGELSLLYNTPHMGTLRAREDSVMYVIGRQALMSGLGRSNRVKEFCELLDQVPVLDSLLSTERWELACRAVGVVDFKPGERILTQGKVRTALRWYIVASGDGVQIRDRQGSDGRLQRVQLAELKRGSHFGERSLLRGDLSSQTSVDAGPQGMSCLTFDGEDIGVLLGKIFQEKTNLLPSLEMDVETYIRRLAEGWDKHTKRSAGRDGAPAVHFSRLRKVRDLGRGGFAKVSLVEEQDTKQRYALKAMSKGFVQKQNALQQIKWERELLAMTNSPFIIRLHTTFFDVQHIFFLLEAATLGSLSFLLHKQSSIFQEDMPHGSAAAFYVACVIAALEHMHERRIVHRDIKPENVLINERGYAKLCDMGFARFVLGKTNTYCGTPEYMAPEMIDFPHSHDVSVDWWSLGVLTFELLSGQTPWEDEGLSDPMTRLLAIRRSQEKNMLTFPFHFPQVARGLVQQLLQKVPSRLGVEGGADAIRKHKFWEVIKFDFQACHSQMMQAPFLNSLAEATVADDAKADDDNLGLKEVDSIYVSFLDEQSDWEKQFLDL
eukprot:TRINITY_DN49402_c0_g1_i1.p1 TRINITY_DN49402_c0_g1~~TRINITY_DN49402_c0_g1_i1.p1  ORF type:complete len:907 (+),score=172.65 TRINITY_DN49402_c0_g1_i1:30-2723(+)